MLFSAFLAENHRGPCYIRLIEATSAVIPLPFPEMWRTIHEATFLCWWMVRFTWEPRGIVGQRSVVCPVELRVCLSVKSQPCSPYCSFCHKSVDKLIFGGWGDFSEVSFQLLTIPSSIVPLQRWNVDDKEAGFSISNPASRTRHF